MSRKKAKTIEPPKRLQNDYHPPGKKNQPPESRPKKEQPSPGKPEYDLSAIKTGLWNQLDEWLGMDIPDEGTMDYVTWEDRQAAIKRMRTVEEAREYLAGLGLDDESIAEYVEPARNDDGAERELLPEKFSALIDKLEKK